MNEELGYVLYPPRRPSEPGYSRLDVNVCATNSGKHFDPYKVNATICTQNGADFATIKHPWSAEKQYVVTAGTIHLEDHLGKSIEALTFGGELRIQESPECTACIFTSPAPIMIDYPQQSVSSLLVDEVEIMFAERKAALGDDPDKYERRLCQADPLALYYACLQAIIERMKHLPQAEDEMSVKFMHLMREEQRYLEEVKGYNLEMSKKLHEIL